MVGEKEWGSFSSFGFSKASSPNSKQPPGRSLLEDVHAATEPAAAETAVVEPVAAQTRSPRLIFGRTKRTVTNPSNGGEALLPSGTSSISEACNQACKYPRGTGSINKVAIAAAYGPTTPPSLLAATRVFPSVEEPVAAVTDASIAWDKSGASEMEMEEEVAREHLERQNTEAATLSRQKIAQSKRLKRLEEEAAAAIEELEAATPTAETSEWEMFLVNFGTWDASRDSISSSEVEMRPGMQWLIENMNRTTLMFDAAEGHNDEDGMSVNLREQHTDRNQALVPNLLYRFETVQERVTRARASLPSAQRAAQVSSWDPRCRQVPQCSQVPWQAPWQAASRSAPRSAPKFCPNSVGCVPWHEHR